MLKSKKHVFWEALLVTVLIFSLGLLVGVSYENNRQAEVRGYYDASEVSLMDIFALNEMIDFNKGDCEELVNSVSVFADRIYEEAKLVEDAVQSDRLTQESKINHRRYDLLRTFLWINSLRVQEECANNFSVVVYLYEYENRDVKNKATQRVWSKLLGELKEDKADEIVLIPIAVDSELSSLDALLNDFDIPQYPAVIINQDIILTELETVDDLLTHFD